MTGDQDLRAELLRRMERDQAARLALIAEGSRRSAGAIEAVTAIDGENLPWFKTVLAEQGWPGRSAVGEEGARAAWLLAQHADRDPAFQRRCLDLMAVAADDGEAAKSLLAYLTDRVLLAEGDLQEFGTQTHAEDGRWAPRPLRDPDHVDERRAAVSLGPLAEYLAGIETRYGPAPPPHAPTIISCPECGGDVELRPQKFPGPFTADYPDCGLSVTITPGAPWPPSTSP